MSELPNLGEKIAAERFFVSKFNVRADENFGLNKKDQALKAHLTTAEIVQPFIARPENKDGHWEPGMDLSSAVGYGVIVGRRRFLAKKDQVTHFVVGRDVLIRELTDEAAFTQSLKENLTIYRQNMDPITRGERLKELMKKYSARSLREWSRKWRISASTLSDWIRVTETSPKIREAIKKRVISFADGLRVLGSEFDVQVQERLGEIALSDGREAFRKELSRLRVGKGKRGIPKNAYVIIRTSFDKRNQKDLEFYQGLEKLAKERKMSIVDYAKEVLIEHISRIEQEKNVVARVV